MNAFDVIDVVVDLGLAAIAIALAVVMFRRSRRGDTLTVRGRTFRHAGLWAWALVLLAVALVLRACIDIVPNGWQGAVAAATVLAAIACLAVVIAAIARSRQP